MVALIFEFAVTRKYYTVSTCYLATKFDQFYFVKDIKNSSMNRFKK